MSKVGHRNNGVMAVALIALGLAGCTSRATKPKHVRLLHIADTHAQLDTHWEYLPEDPSHLHRMGGYARLRTALDQMRASAPGAVFTVDGGDTFQGSALAAWTEGQSVVAPFNALGIDVGTPGNWEVVYGPRIFRKLMGAVTEKVVCYNFHEKATGKRLFEPATILERNGVRVAFVGVTDPTTSIRQAPVEVAGLDTTRMEGLREFVQQLKRTQKPDLTVLVDHTGLAPSVQIAHNIPEFDVVLSGHTHERVYRPIRVGRTIVVEPGSMGSFIGRLDLTLENGAITDSEFDLVPIEESRFAENRDVKALIDRDEAPFLERLHEVVGRTTEPLLRYDVLESTMDNVIADAVRDAGHSNLALTNGFRFSPPIAPGAITEADLWNMLPFDTRMKSGRATGEQLRAYLENEMELVFSRDPFALSGGWGPRPSGMKVVFQAQAAQGRRIGQVEIDGAPLDPTRVYTIAGCEREGEPMDVICRLRGAQDSRYVGGTVHAALRRYLREHSPIAPTREERVRATDLPDKVWSQYGTLQQLWHIPGDAAAVRAPGQ
jgi:sulfur-oxidizing protein SoxB